jgi:hypothetical protein
LRGKSASRAQDKVPVNGASLESARTEDLELQTGAGLKPEPIARARERHQAFKLVITVGSASDYTKG